MKKRTGIVLAVSVFLVTGLLMYREVQRVSSTEMTSWDRNITADCAVVLTGASHRIKEGIDLLERRSVKKLIISGVNPEVSLREIFPHLPFFSQILTEDIILEKQSLTTFGNALQTRMIAIEEIGCKDLILVTSNVHMYRARRTFRTAFPEGYTIYEWPVLYGRSYRPRLDELLVEALKSLFYSTFAYWRNPIFFN